jgi:flagellar protein FlgJ
MDQGVSDVKEVLLPVGTGAGDASRKMKERAEQEEKLKKACADFESIFIYNMLQKMRSTVPKSGLLTEMQGKGTYNAMIDQKVAEDMAKNGGLGLQKMLFDQITAAGLWK